MSGLPDDFAVRRDDIPQQAFDDAPGRALPAGVLNQLIAALPILEQSASPAFRAAVELLMDTGRLLILKIPASSAGTAWTRTPMASTP